MNTAMKSATPGKTRKQERQQPLQNSLLRDAEDARVIDHPRPASDDITLMRKNPKARDEFNTISLYLEEIRVHPLLSAEEEIHYGRLSRQGDKKSRRLMIVSNLRLVVKIARGYYNRGMAFLDLVEEGNLGLIRAVEKFDPERGCRFSTYASWWIRQSIERGIMDHSHTVGLPVHIQKEYFHYNKTAREMAKAGCDNPGADEIAAFLGVSPERVRHIWEWCKRTTVSTSVNEEDDSVSPLEFMADEVLLDPAETLEDMDEHNRLHSLFAQLSDRERQVVQCRYGLNGADQSTLADIGRNLGISHERVRQIQAKALRRLRDMLS